MPYTLTELVTVVEERGYRLTVQGVYKAMSEGRVDLARFMLRKPSGSQAALYSAGAIEELVRYCERRRVGQKPGARLEIRQPPEIVEARIKELHERFPDEEYRMEMLIRLLKGDMGRFVERREDVA